MRDLFAEACERFDEHQNALRLARLLASASEATLSKYPRGGLLGDQEDQFYKTVRDLARALTQVADGHQQSVRVSLSEPFSPDMLHVLLDFGKKQEQFDINVGPLFVPLIRAQQLVMTYAHMDAFLSDIVRIACSAKPEIMKSSKRSMQWDDIVELGGWEAVLDHMINIYASRFDRKSLKKRLQLLIKDIDSPTYRLFVDSEPVRHDIVHNGMRASAESAQVLDIAPGSRIEITGGFANRCSEQCLALSRHVMRSMASKFFGRELPLPQGPDFDQDGAPVATISRHSGDGFPILIRTGQ